MADARTNEVKTLTRVELDAVRCSRCRARCRGANHSIMPRCHRDAGVEVLYIGAHGHIVLVCKSCGVGVARIQVAWAVPS